MKRLLLILSFAFLTPTTASPQDAAPAPILPESLSWTTAAEEPRVQGAYVIGAEDESGIYLFRVRLQKGGRIPPHRHPDIRHSTVLSGTLYVGFGEQDDESRMVAIPTGAVYTAPAGVPHYLLARDGDVVYQEVGFGPTGFAPVAGRVPP